MNIRDPSFTIFTAVIVFALPSLVFAFFAFPLSTGDATKHNVTSTMESNQATTSTSFKVRPFAGRIKNFRQAGGVQNVYRSATPDVLADMDFSRRKEWADCDRFVFEQIGLILDLRSPNEVNQSKSKGWMSMAPPKGFHIIEADYASLEEKEFLRLAVRFDILSPPRFMSYIEENWLNSVEKRQAVASRRLGNGEFASGLCIEKLNESGLFGLNQLILELGKEELCRALRTITVHLEQNSNDEVLIHCAQGKDRTGMLVMLLQSILGYPNEVIIEEYFLSDRMLRSAGSAAVAAALGKRKPGRLNWHIFSRATRESMIATLEFLRKRYGSVSPGYLDHIGFDQSWRGRILGVLKPVPLSNSSKL